eukprot:TCALIF_02446-PA protein Name:"Similar to Ipo9 Importin-9 (Mus musculus)" AED:0.08 eAED:0.08 QI:0/0.33/0.2/0.9/1/1/10/0/889
MEKVRSSVAFTLATIGHWDWPEQWPDLFNIIMAALQDPSEYAVQGAVRVLKEFARDLTDSQIPAVAPVIIPDMYRIFMEQERYTIRTRTRAIEIFTTMASMICAMAEVNKSLSKSLLSPILPTFTDALIDGLSIPDDSHLTDAGLKTEVLKALTVLIKNVPKSMASWLGSILPPVWATLTSSASKYVKEVVNQTGDEDEVVDSDGEVLGFENLVFAIFDFVHALIETPRYRVAVKSGAANLMFYIVIYMQMTEEQCEKWNGNPEQFVEEEDEDSFSYSAICDEFDEEACTALVQTIERHITEAEQAKQHGNPTWWKIHEACMLALGTVQEILLRQIKEGSVKLIPVPDSPFLLGRCLWIASKFSDQMPNHTVQPFLEATVRALQADQISIVRISAVRAIWGFCSHLKSRADRRNLLVPVLPAVLDALVNMCTTYNSSPEILGLVLENMTVVLSCDKTFTSSHENKISPLVIAIFLKFNSDPVLTSLVQDIFKVLSQTEGCLLPLQTRLVPTLVSILSPNSEAKTVAPGLQAVALDVLQTLVRASNPPLSDLLMSNAFPVAANCTLHSDDNAIMQSGGECLRSFVAVAPEQICHFHDNEGKSGLWYMVQVAGHLLNPVGSEFTATFVGRLVTTLIQKTGDQLGEHLDLLLKAVLSKLQGSETLTVLNFLSSVPGPTGEPALNFVLAEWVSRQHIFYGDYENKVTMVALAKLLQHGVNNNDTRLQGILVKGDQVVSDSKARTRSQKKTLPDEWTTIPVLAKILKLIVNEMTNHLDVLASQRDEEEDTDEEDWEDEEGSGMTTGAGPSSSSKQEKCTDLSKLLDPEFNIYEDEDDEEDPDAKADPIYRMNLKSYLTEFLNEFCQQPYFLTHFAQHLTPVEKSSLKQIGIPVP